MNEREARMKSLQDDLQEKRRRLEEIARARRQLQEGKTKSMLATTIDPSASQEHRSGGNSWSPLAGTSPLSSGTSGISFAQAPLRSLAEELQQPHKEQTHIKSKETIEAPALPRSKLTVSQQIICDIPPLRQESYSKEVMTDLQGAEMANTFASHASVDDQDSEVLGSPSVAHDQQPSSSTTTPIATSSTANAPSASPSVMPEKPAELTPQQRRAVMGDPLFHEFLSRTSFLMERALNVNFDVIMDVGSSAPQPEKMTESVRPRQSFVDDKWSRNKAVTSLSFHPTQPELFLAAYHQRNDGALQSHKHSGSCILVWSLHLPQRAAFVYHSQSSVARAFHCKHRPHLIVGSTYAGQIVLWDTRQGSDPVMQSTISSETHTFPVFGLQVVGNASSHSLVSLSTDGRLCVWSLDNLAQPQDSLDLSLLVDMTEATRAQRDITCCTLSFPAQEQSRFFVGSEDGGLYHGSRHGGASRFVDRFEGHCGPVTATHCHPNAGGTGDLGDLVLTASMDASCKLWAPSRLRDRHPARCLHSFDVDQDYVFDVQWSPVHPAVFASVDGQGELHLWHLNQSLDFPVARLGVTGGAAANRLGWAADGRAVAVGDLRGGVHLCDVAPALASPEPDDWTRLQARLADLALL